MGRMKDFAMKVSEEMGFGGDITDEVRAECSRRLAETEAEDYRAEQFQKIAEDRGLTDDDEEN